MMLTPNNYQTTEYPRIYFPAPGLSEESHQISEIFQRNSLLEPISENGINADNIQTYLEPLTDHELDYNSPKPKRSYKMKVRVVSISKGKPVNYDE